MEEERMEQQTQEQESYTPRPAWQVWAARIGLLLFLAVLAFYYYNIARGGM